MRPLYDAVKKYARVKGRFHMPSHGGNPRALFPKKRERLYASCAFDITELSFSDNLASPQGVIREAEELAAKAYGAEKTLFFAGGATDAVRVALLLVKGKKIAFFGDMHKSFHSIARLFSLDVTPVETLAELEEKKFEAVCVTSPDYFGRVKDVSAIAAVTKKIGAALIVDEAHGAHFAFSSLFPKSAVECADLVIHGAHKTLPVYTGGAMLHVKNDLYEAAVSARRECVSTSPSYLVMASLDFARDFMEKKGEALYARLKNKLDGLKKAYLDVQTLPADDFSRLTIFAPGAGHALAAHLEKGGIFAEAQDADKVTFIVTPFNERYLKKLFSLCRGFSGKNAEYADFSDLIGKVSAEDVGVYPPGVPLVRTGEVFTEEKVKILERNSDRLFGAPGGKIRTK